MAFLFRWLIGHRSTFISLCVGIFLILMLPSLISTKWGGYCLQQLIHSTTRFEVTWKIGKIGWFFDSYIEDLVITDPRAKTKIYVQRLDSTWRPSFLFTSPRFLGTTCLQGAHITFSLLNSHTEKWPYPFIPATLETSLPSAIPFYGTVYAALATVDCFILSEMPLTVDNITLSLEVPADYQTITCAFSALPHQVQAHNQMPTLSGLVEYTPLRPRKLLQTHAESLQALAENRLHLNIQADHFPSLLLDALFRIRHPERPALLSDLVGPVFTCSIRTPTDVSSPHLLLKCRSAFLQGACSMQLSRSHIALSTQEPIQWTPPPELLSELLKPLVPVPLTLQMPTTLTCTTQDLLLTPDKQYIAITGLIHAGLTPLSMLLTSAAIPINTSPIRTTWLLNPTHLHWDTQFQIEWDHKNFPFSSAGDYAISERTLKIGNIHHLHASVELLPTQLLDLLLMQNDRFQPFLGDTLDLDLAVTKEPEQGHIIRLQCSAPKLTCDPIECLYAKQTLTLLHPFQVDIQAFSQPLHLLCRHLSTSALHPLEAKLTFQTCDVDLSLSTCKCDLSSKEPLGFAGNATISQKPSLDATNTTSFSWISSNLLGSSASCMFSATYDPLDISASKIELFLSGEGLEGELSASLLEPQKVQLQRNQFTWKMGQQRFRALQELWPALKAWSLSEDAILLLAAQNGPLHLSWDALKTNPPPLKLRASPLALKHLPSGYACALHLDAFLEKNNNVSVHGSFFTDLEKDIPTFTLEGSWENKTCLFTGDFLPTSLLSVFLYNLPSEEALAKWFMGENFFIKGACAQLTDSQQFSLDVTNALGLTLHVDAKHHASRYELLAPCILKMPFSLLMRPIDPNLPFSSNTSQFFNTLQSKVVPENPDSNLALTLMPENAFLQLPVSSWNDAGFDTLILALDPVLLNLGKKRSKLSAILPHDLATDSKPFSVMTTPFSFSLHEGVLNLKRVDALVSQRYPIAFWGRVRIPKSHAKATLAISSTALRLGYGLSDVERGYYLLLPMSGPINKVSLHKTKALTRLTALSLHSNGGIPGAFLGSFAQWLSGGFDQDAIPPPTFPIPWQELEEELLKEQDERERNEPKSLPKTLIAPLQAVHRGIQKGVRKGADLLFNLLR